MSGVLQPLGKRQQWSRVPDHARGKNGNYFGNALFADDKHRLAKAFDGELEGACILGTTTMGGVLGGLENRIPSGDTTSPPLTLAGTGFRLTQQTKQPLPD